MKSNKKGAELADSSLKGVGGGYKKLEDGRYMVTWWCPPGMCGMAAPQFFDNEEDAKKAQAEQDKRKQQWEAEHPNGKA